MHHDPEAPVGGRPGAWRCWGPPSPAPRQARVCGRGEGLSQRQATRAPAACSARASQAQAGLRKGPGEWPRPGPHCPVTVRQGPGRDPAQATCLLLVRGLLHPPCSANGTAGDARDGLGQGPWSAASKTLTLAKCPPIEPPVTPVLGPRRSGCRVSCLSGPVFAQAEGLGDGGRTRCVLVATSPCWKTPGTSQSPLPSGAPAAHPLCRAVPAAPPAVARRSPPWHVQRPRGLEVPLDTLTPSAAQGTIWWAAKCVKSHPSGPRIPRHSLPCSVKPGVGVRARACAHTRTDRPAPNPGSASVRTAHVHA